jgi:hypothetical protein
MYGSQGHWQDAEELQVRTTQAMRVLYGYKHPETLLSMNNLSSMYMIQERWKETKELQLQVVQTRKSVPGETHPHTLTSTVS